ncbi:MAG: hypothetical protein D6679_08460 [Candidatus Hydrogenedentota bacterium]|nr:MAG: hypothetical protein D6679_08460 [Candidatus Hydrogenedentota bacterium]
MIRNFTKEPFLAVFLVLLIFLIPSCGTSPKPDLQARSASRTRASPGTPSPHMDGPRAPVPGIISGPDYAQTVTNDQYLPTALRLIRSARSDILAVQFLFIYGPATKKIQKALGEAVGRGVRVRVLLDEESHRTRESVRHLRRRGIDAKLDSLERRTHTKLLIADNTALFGSTNWTTTSMTRNNEVNLLLTIPKLVEALRAYADFLWDSSAEPYRVPPVRVRGIRLLFDQDYLPAAEDLLRKASKIDLQLYGVRYYNDPQSPSTHLVDLVADAARKGERVRAIIEESDFNEATNSGNLEAVEILRRAGAEVLRDPYHVTSHAKMLLTDRGVIIGSTNWGYEALAERHELNVLVENPAVAAPLREYFEALYRAAKE